MRDIAIHTEQLTKRFGPFVAVDAISFDVYEGEIFGFLGANGAGKTTAMRMLCGLSRPTSGKAVVAGLDMATHTEQIKKQIGYMSQKFSLYDDLTVLENIRFFGGIYGLSLSAIRAKTDELIGKLGLEQEAKKWFAPSHWDGSRNYPSPYPSCMNPGLCFLMNLPVAWTR